MKLQEQLIRDVNVIGNGAHIFVPRGWLNQKVLVIKIPNLDIKEQILKVLEPHLDNVIGIFLYGSYARGEQEKDSDIDVLLIVRKKFRIEKKEKLSFEVLEYDNLREKINSNPLMFYPILQEAKPIMNSLLLEELKKIKFDPKAPMLRWFIDSTKDYIKTNKEFIELDKLDGKYLESYCVIYSIILRLRGILLVRGALHNKFYTRKLFREWLIKNIPYIEYNKVYYVYRAEREGKKIKVKIKISRAEDLLNFLVKEIKKLEIELYGK